MYSGVGGKEIFKDFLKYGQKETAHLGNYIALVGNTSDLYGGKVENVEAHSLLMAATSLLVRRKGF